MVGKWGKVWRVWITEIFVCRQKAAYEISSCLVGSEVCIRDS